MQRFRTLLFWSHLAAGLFAGAVVLIMSVTGVLLAYQRQITVWADARAAHAPPPSPGAQRLGPEALLERVLRAEPGTPTAITWRADPDAPVQVAFGRERRVFASAYTGEVLGEGAAGTRKFFKVTTDVHRWLAAPEESRAWGKHVTGASNLAFLFLVVSGVYLWWPRDWGKRILWFRRGLRARARDFNWHNTIGFWTAVPLFVIVLSGVVISYRWAGDAVYRLAGESPPAPGGEGGRGESKGPPVLAGADALWPAVQRRVPEWRIITLNLPRSPEAPLAFTLDRGNGGEPHKRASLQLDRATGEVKKWEPFTAQSTGRKARGILRFAHTGEVLGLFGQTVAMIASLGAAVLVWTGIALSLRRFRAWRGRRATPRPVRARGRETVEV
jgi:uncharacterized iron-regulated membrane protein